MAVEVGLFLRGMMIGLAVAAPVGPVGVLCIRRTISDGRLNGFLAGLGAAVADALFGLTAALGLSVLSGTLLSHQIWLQAVGGAFVAVIGLRLTLTPPAIREQPGFCPKTFAKTFATTFVLTATNPLTVIGFGAIYAGFGLTAALTDHGKAGTLTLGVFLGSALWWLILSGIAGAVRDRLTPQTLGRINRVCGAVLIVIGTGALIGLAAP